MSGAGLLTLLRAETHFIPAPIWPPGLRKKVVVVAMSTWL
jgi:hypothetical protein